VAKSAAGRGLPPCARPPAAKGAIGQSLGGDGGGGGLDLVWHQRFSPDGYDVGLTVAWRRGAAKLGGEHGLRFMLRRDCIVSSLGRCLGGSWIPWCTCWNLGIDGAAMYTHNRWRSMVDEESGRVRPHCSLVDLLDAN
jgi:hypothetical protein